MSKENLAINTAEAENCLIRNWWLNYEPFLPAPTVNRERFIQLLQEARSTGKPLGIVAMGCVVWKTPEWGNNIDRIIGLITSDNKRARRFSQEFASLQRALASFGIETIAFFTLSDLEAQIHIELGDMGLKIQNKEDAPFNIESSIRNVLTLIRKAGGNVTPFVHSEIAQSICQTSSLIDLRHSICKKHPRPTFEQFLHDLYAFDLRQLPSFLFPQETGVVGPIWLDLISPDQYPEDVNVFRKIASEVASKLVIIAPFRNAGDWIGAPKPSFIVPGKKEFISARLGINPQLEKQRWLDAVRRRPDKEIAEALSLLEVILEIDSQPLQLTAIKVLASFALDWEPDPEDQFLKVSINPGTNLKEVVASCLQVNRTQAKNLISAGVVSIDGVEITDPKMPIGDNVQQVRVGKRTFHIEVV